MIWHALCVWGAVPVVTPLKHKGHLVSVEYDDGAGGVVKDYQWEEAPHWYEVGTLPAEQSRLAKLVDLDPEVYEHDR